MTDKPQIDAWHRKEHPEALMPLREAWTALPERDRGDLVERWRRARSLSEEASGTQLDAWGVFLDLPRGKAMDKRTDQLVSEPDEEYRAVLLERLGPGDRQDLATILSRIRGDISSRTAKQTGRYPGARIPLSREEARRVAADPSCCSCGGGGWVAHVGTLSGEGSFPCQACIRRNHEARTRRVEARVPGTAHVWGDGSLVRTRDGALERDYRDRLIEATEQRRWPKPELAPLQRLREAVDGE